MTSIPSGPFRFAGGVLNCIDDMLIACAAAQIPIKPVTNLFIRRAGVSVEQLRRSHDHTRCAIAALQAVLFPESFLNRVKFACGGKPFDGLDARPIDLNGEQGA